MDNKTRKAFNITGTIFFITATLYFAMLLWKAYVWYNWLNQLQQQLIKQQPPTMTPFADPENIAYLREGDLELASKSQPTFRRYSTSESE